MRDRFLVLAFITLSMIGWPVMADVVIRGVTVTNIERESLPTSPMLPVQMPTLGGLASVLGPEQNPAIIGFLKKLGFSDEPGGQLGPAAPTRTSEDFVIYIKDRRMRMDSGEKTMFISRIKGESNIGMWLFDKKQRAAVRLQAGVRADGATYSTASNVDNALTLIGPGPGWQGRATRKYSYLFSTASQPQAAAAGAPGNLLGPPESTPAFYVQITTSGNMNVVPDMPGLKEVQDFYRHVASRFGPEEHPDYGGMTATLSRNLAVLSGKGMPVEVSEIAFAKAYFSLQDRDESHLVNLGRTTTKTTVTSVLVIDDLDASLLEPTVPADYEDVTPGAASEAPAKAACDCSCASFEAYMALARRKKDPAAQSEVVAMGACANGCMSQWMQCRPKR